MKTARALILALILCTVTASFLGGTLAKFSMIEKGINQATVARWGITVSLEGNLFGSRYLDADQTDPNRITEGAEHISVQSVHKANVGTEEEKTLNVVAPGTKGNTVAISLIGTSEVAACVEATVLVQSIYLKSGTYGIMTPCNTVTEKNFSRMLDSLYLDTGTQDVPVYSKLSEDAVFDADATYYTIENQVALSRDYYPVVFASTGFAGNDAVDSLNALAALIAGVVKGTAVLPASPATEGAYIGKSLYEVTSPTLPAGTDFDQLLVGTGQSLEITWEWLIDSGSTDAEKQMLTGADTFLGMLAADHKNAVLVGTNGEVTLLEVDDTCGLVTAEGANGTRTVLASLKTSLEIDLTVAQKD